MPLNTLEMLRYIFPIAIGIASFLCTRGTDGNLFLFITLLSIFFLLQSILVHTDPKFNTKTSILIYSLTLIMITPSIFLNQLEGMAGMLPLMIVALTTTLFLISLGQVFLTRKVFKKNHHDKTNKVS